MAPEQRDQKIESFGNAYHVLVDNLSLFPKEMWNFQDEHGCWSIHEHLVHIADSEANSYIRCRRLIAEPGKSLMAYDENQWAQALDYRSQSNEEALELFRWLRHGTYTLIKSLPERAWDNSGYHPENGNMTLDDWLDIYERHIPEHVQYMRENYETCARTTRLGARFFELRRRPHDNDRTH